jgi:putative aldouronate transport system permease protein
MFNKVSAFDIVNAVLLGLFCVVCLYPFINIIALSLNTGTDSMRGGITLWPRVLTFANYIVVLRNGLVLGAYKVTILRTLLGSLLTIAVTAVVAYGLSERNLPGKKAIMTYMLIPMFFSGGIIPNYLVLRGLGLTNTFWVYIVPGMFSIWTCIVMKTSFQDIPVSLKEAIRIDGGNEFTILRHIVLPVSMPMFAALLIFAAVGHWNDWFAGAYYVRDNNLMPVQTYLMHIMSTDITSMADKISSQGTASVTGVAADTLGAGGIGKVTSMSLKMAIVVIGTLPILLVYPFLQRYFIKGVLVGSIKE